MEILVYVSNRYLDFVQTSDRFHWSVMITWTKNSRKFWCMYTLATDLCTLVPLCNHSICELVDIVEAYSYCDVVKKNIF